jgi:serine phosphatase RsbU (regulator of sigma subunit)
VTSSFSNTAYTSDFHHEVENAEKRLLRRRFMLFTAISGGLGVLLTLVGLAAVFGARWMAESAGPMSNGAVQISVGGDEVGTMLKILLLSGSSTVLYVTCFVTSWRGKLSWESLRQLSYWLVFLDGLLQLIAKSADFGGMGVFGVMLSHIIAAAFLPWTPRQSLTPMLPLLVINAGIVLSREQVGPGTFIAIFISCFAAAPGTLICWLKSSMRLERHKMRFLQKRYTEVRRELIDAQRIHQGLFPQPRESGPVVFRYRYEPMRQIGGDFLFFHHHETGDQRGNASVVLLDVTGHGIPAALTVNRLHGELERVFAEHPSIPPSEVLRLLNRYVHLTLAHHSVYATAFCCRVDHAADRLEYASGGHPPAFIRGVDGTLDQLRDTAPQLGIYHDSQFDCDPPRTVGFRRGDSIIAYTDGAIEAQDRDGRMFGLAGIERLLARRTGQARPVDLDWTREVMQAVESFRFGPAADDTLVIELTRPVE